MGFVRIESSRRRSTSWVFIMSVTALCMGCASPGPSPIPAKAVEVEKPAHIGEDVHESGQDAPPVVGIGDLAVHLVEVLDDGGVAMHLGAPRFAESELGEYRQYNLRTWVRQARVESHGDVLVGQKIQAVRVSDVVHCTVTGFAEVTRGVAKTQALLDSGASAQGRASDVEPLCGNAAAFAYLDCDEEIDDVAVGLLDLDVIPVHYLASMELSWDFVDVLTRHAQRSPGFGRVRELAMEHSEKKGTGYAEGVDYSLHTPTRRVSPRARDLVVLNANAFSGAGDSKCNDDYHGARRFILGVEDEVITAVLMEDAPIEDRTEEVLFLVDLNADGVPEILRRASGHGIRLAVESLESVLDASVIHDCNARCL